MGITRKKQPLLDLDMRMAGLEDSHHRIRMALSTEKATAMRAQRNNEVMDIFDDLQEGKYPEAAAKTEEFCTFLKDKMGIGVLKPAYKAMTARLESLAAQNITDDRVEFFSAIVEKLKDYREEKDLYKVGNLTVAEATYINGGTIKNETDEDGWMIRSTQMEPPGTDGNEHGLKTILDNDANYSASINGMTATQKFFHEENDKLKQVVQYRNFGIAPVFELDQMLKDGIEETYDLDGVTLLESVTYKKGEKHGPTLTRVGDHMEEGFNFHDRPIAETFKELNEIGYVITTGNKPASNKLKLN